MTTLRGTAILLLVAAACCLGTQIPSEREECRFILKERIARASVTGPREVVDSFYVIDQPDSPVEIVSVDLEGSYLGVARERYTWEPRCKVRVRNVSDRTVPPMGITIFVWSSSGGGIGAGGGPVSLAPGQETEIAIGNDRVDGEAPNNHVRLLVGIERVEFATCGYRPSLRIPRSWKVQRLP